ncbi:MAG: hypothetical protein JO353_07670, partial [Phycisphaerae bacterium]|nr:hypothetical protein [Phycisphaerae bacterium]
EGEVNANDVFVHSGPSENDYATMKLEHGTKVTVVGIRFDWLKVLPPEGSFCYVAKVFTERRGDGTVGRVTNALNVHVGSALNSLKVKIACRLEPNTDVQIVGEQDEYFKIKPPAGVYVYINKQYVTPVRAVAVKTGDQGETSVSPIAPTPPPTPSNTPENGANPTDQASTTTTQPTQMTGALPTTQQSGNQTALAPTTQPDAASAQADFDKLETDFAADIAKPLDQQHPAELAAGYDKVAKSGLLPDSLRKVAEYKATALKAHADDQKEFVAVKKRQDETKARMASLQAERAELEVRVKQTEVKSYAAVGTLRPSSLQQGPQMLYRLTDPNTGRTVLYIRSNDPKIGSIVNQFVGVQGAIVDDPVLSLRVIDPTTIDPVEQSKLYTSVMAQIVPPSLLPSGQASTSTP